MALYISSARCPSNEDAAIMKRCLFQIVYPIIECAELASCEAMEYLKRQEFYKLNLKRLSVKAKKDMDLGVSRCQQDCDKDFVEEYAARIEDRIYPDILNIRNSISVIMQKNGYKYSSTMCRFEIVSILLQVAVMAFDGVEDNNFKRTGIRYSKMFKYYRVLDIYKSWKRVGDEVYRLTLDKNFDMNQYKKPKELLDQFYNDLFNSDLMMETLDKLVKEYK